MSGPGLQLPPSDPRFAILDRLRKPALMLLSVGFLNIFFSLVVIAAALFEVPSPTPPPPGESPVLLQMSLGLLISMAASMVCGGVTIWGALNSVNLKGYGIAYMGALTALFPLSPTCVVGFPFSVWMMYTLNQPEVRKVFAP